MIEDLLFELDYLDWKSSTLLDITPLCSVKEI